jgi:hypothetical protein
VLAGREVARPKTEPIGCSMRRNAANADLDQGPSPAELW